MSEKSEGNQLPNTQGILTNIVPWMERMFQDWSQDKALVPNTCLPNELRMVLVGKTGVGKSETGNTIAGKQIFVAAESGSSVTSECKQHTFTRNGQNLQLIDVPGFIDTKLSRKDVKKEIVKCVALSHPGIHAILFVTQIGRFTEDDISTIEEFCKCFGKDSTAYVIVIFTRMDALRTKTFEQFISECPTTLTSFLAKINHRYLTVNNWSENDAHKELFFENLLSMVRSLVESNSGRCYTNRMYQKATKVLVEETEKAIKRLAEIERERDEEKLRKTREEYEQKQKQLEMEMKKQMKARQVEIERIAEQKRKQEEEKRKKAEVEYKRQLEQRTMEQEAKDRQIKAIQIEMEKRAEEERARLQEEKRKAEKEFERKQKEEVERMKREMKESEERLRKEIEEERRAEAIRNQREEIAKSRGFFGKIFDSICDFAEDVKDWIVEKFE